MGDLRNGRARVLVAPCGHIAGADLTDEIPGFARTVDEASEDVRLGYTERQMDVEELRATWVECDHQPEWGVHRD